MDVVEVTLTNPLSADRAAPLGLPVREYAVGETVPLLEVDADRLRAAGYVAPLGGGDPVVVNVVTIYDPSGSAMLQRGKLQFTGGVTVTDDPVNARTVVNVTGGGGGGSSVTSVNGRTGTVVLTASDVGALTQTAADALYAPVGSGVPTIDNIPAGSTVTVLKSGSTWPARPTARSDIIVRWRGADPSPSIVSSGTGGMLNNVDERQIPAP